MLNFIVSWKTFPKEKLQEGVMRQQEEHRYAEDMRIDPLEPHVHLQMNMKGLA